MTTEKNEKVRINPNLIKFVERTMLPDVNSLVLFEDYHIGFFKETEHEINRKVMELMRNASGKVPVE